MHYGDSHHISECRQHDCSSVKNVEDLSHFIDKLKTKFLNLLRTSRWVPSESDVMPLHFFERICWIDSNDNMKLLQKVENYSPTLWLFVGIIQKDVRRFSQKQRLLLYCYSIWTPFLNLQHRILFWFDSTPNETVSTILNTNIR